MDSQFFRAVEQSAAVLTPGKRLSRSLVEEYHQGQRNRGRSVWKTPRILPLDTWLEQLWFGHAPTLLNEVQERALWERIIAESPAGRSLLRIPETADEAAKAWALAHEYGLPFERSAFSVSDDCEAFFDWAREFGQRCKASGWMEKARLPGVIAASIRSGRMERPFPIVLHGFDELTPQQQDLAEALCATVHRAPVHDDCTPPAFGFRDTKDEIAHAAAWARTRLEANGAAQIGVVVPEIRVVRSKLQRAFHDVLPGAFHISLGPALREWPLVHAALLLLELAAGEVEIDRLGMMLRNPYWKGADQERSSRAMLDAALRRDGRSRLSIARLRSLADRCPILVRGLGSLEKEIRRLPPEQPPSEWSRTFSRLLKQAGWPGDRPLSSEEFQVMEAWNKLLSSFATLDVVIARIDINDALARLHTLAAREFQTKNEGAPVQIGGLLEAGGLRFDHLWVMGLHDEQIPQAARPNPFLPLGLQRDHGTPHCSPQRELEFSRQQLGRLWASAPDVVFSYPQWEGDQSRGPSPLVRAEPSSTTPVAPLWRDVIHASRSFEVLEDRSAPVLPPETKQPGGTRMLKDMAACPFSAFAKNRLGARELEETELGLSARDKGTGVHKVLELIWKELKSQEALRALDNDQLQNLISAKILEALPDDDRLGVQLERRRLERLLTQWFEIEKVRPPFHVLEHEKDRSALIGGLIITTRIDRVDELPDGRQVIIDYKTGKVKGGAWSGERLDEPQVPLYCINNASPIAGAAFAQIRAGDLQMRGISANGALGKIKTMELPKGAALSEVIREWERSIHQLADAFRNGAADVDPKAKSTCDFCRLPALCRIHDHHD